MVVVRESPRAKVSPDKIDTQWPPKSPFQALLSSPSGKKKWQDRAGYSRERSISPSPRKAVSSSRKLQELAGSSSEEEEEGEDEDEETLQLQLQAIQAKLRLKKLQARKKEVSGESKNKSEQTSKARSPSKLAALPQPKASRSNVEVPLSPTRDRIIQPQHQQLSPARRRLGLEIAARAEHVSLKRARDGTQIKRSESTRTMRGAAQLPGKAASSFNDRLKRSKTDAEEKRAKTERIEQSRSKGFDILSDKPSLCQTRKTANEHTKTRSQIDHDGVRLGHLDQRNSNNRTNDNHLQRNASARSAQIVHPSVSSVAAKRSRLPRHTTAQHDDDSGETSSGDTDSSVDASGYDLFSQLHLSKRHIAHPTIARALEEKEIYTLPRLLKEVTAPHYDPPDCENDFVVFAILASKTNPFDHKPSHRTSDEDKPQEDANAPRNKFMVLKLTDLKWEVDCFLFGTAFDQFWKLTPGTLLAILNPSILPPKVNVHNGRFSLKLGSSEDCVMEIGVARDLGWCNAVKKDGQQCGAWVNKHKTEACEFHINLLIERERKGRMEVNTMWRGHGNGGDSSAKAKSTGQNPNGTRARKKDAGDFHREYGQLYSVQSGVGKTAAGLLDAEDTDTLSNLTAGELSRKRMAEAQRERDLAKALGQNGFGVGAEYLRAKHNTTPGTKSSAAKTTSEQRDGGGNYFDKPSASELGLLSRKATDVHLSPAKDRKRHFGMGANSSHHGGGHSAEAMGWGGARKSGLLQPKENRLGSPERDQQHLGFEPVKRGTVRPRSQGSSSAGTLNLSPKKRARFQLEKGIREPGRESGGNELSKLADDDNDDEDDDLDIV